MRLRGMILSLLICLCASLAKAESPYVYRLTNELTHHVVTVLKEMRSKGVQLDHYCEECSENLKTRHVFQRAIDINESLSAFLKMHGYSTDDNDVIPFKQYTIEDLEKLLFAIDEKLEIILHANEVDVDHATINNISSQQRDSYAVLDRIENFLLAIGAPSIQPKTVLRRAKAISQIVKSLCRSEVCPDVHPLSPKDVDPKMPLHVYREVHQLVEQLHNYAQINKVTLAGGVTLPPIHKDMITPRVVNKASGILIADLIAIRHQMGDRGTLTLDPIQQRVTPSHVWIELNFARRYLEALLY